jgi:hypothetical protein
MTNDPWSSFAVALKREMTRTSTSSHVLAGRLRKIDSSVTDESVANWRRKRARPSLELLGPIVDALNVERRTKPGEDPFSLLHLLQEMKVIPKTSDNPRLFDPAYRLLKMQLKQQDAEDAFSDLGRQAGAARVVQAAVKSSKWAVSVWPLYEGPDSSSRIHVADRIDIHRLEPDERAVDDSVWSFPAMKNALRATNAMPSEHHDDHRWPNLTPTETSKWAISHVTSSREPIVSSAWSGLRGVALVSTTGKGWVNEIASLVATGLGYGLITTSQLAMTAFGRRPNEIRLLDLYTFHEGLLDRPPHRRVWSHWGVPPGMAMPPFGTYSNTVDSTPRFVFLDENNDILQRARGERLTFKELDDARSRLRIAADAFPSSHLLPLPIEDHDDPSDQWDQIFRSAAAILKWLRAPGRGTFAPRDVRDAHAHSATRDPGVAKPFLEWLHTKGGWAV